MSGDRTTFLALLDRLGVAALRVRFIETLESYIHVEVEGLEYAVWPPLRVLRDMERYMHNKPGPHWFTVTLERVAGEFRGWHVLYDQETV